MYKYLLSALLLSTAFVPMTPLKAASIDGFANSDAFDYATPRVSNNGLVMAGSYFDSNVSDLSAYKFANGTFQQLDTLAGGSYAFVNDINDDGSVIVGESDDGSTTLAVRWVNGTTVESLGALTMGGDSRAIAVSSDGNVIVGDSNNQAVKWVGNNPITALGFLAGGSSSFAQDVSADGNVIVGIAENASSDFRGVRWVNGGAIEDLGVLAGGDDSFADFVSGDGNVIIGRANDANYNLRAVRWVGNNAVEGLDMDVSLVSSRVTRTNYDGSVIIGYGVDGSANDQALRWVGNDPVQILGTYSGGDNARALSLNSDGSVVVGYSEDAATALHAVRWVDGGAAEAISDLLAAQNVDLTGWTLNKATGISDDGDVVVGAGYLGGDDVNFIANLATGGVTTPGDISQSVSSVAQSSQSVMQATSAQMGQSLFVARHMVSKFPNANMPSAMNANDLSNVSTAAGGPQPSTWELYTIGGVGLGSDNNYSNNNFNGTVGVKKRITNDLGIGAGVIGSTGRSELAFNGQSDMDALGGSFMTAYEPESGLRVYGTAFVADINVDITRGYLNGASLDSSRGNTGGIAYGAAVQGGWSFPVSEKSSVMPYVEGRWSKTKLDAYNETGGAFAGSFSSQDQTNVASRIGFEHNYLMMPNFNLSSRLAWGHRLSGNGNGVTATVSGLTQTMGGNAGDRDWAEVAVGGSWRASSATTLGAELSGRSGETSEPQMGLVVSASIAF